MHAGIRAGVPARILQSDLPRTPPVWLSWYNLSMTRRHEKPSRRMGPSPAGEGRAIADALREFELPSSNRRLSDLEREAIQQGSDAAKVGSFAPEEEMDEFYRLHLRAELQKGIDSLGLGEGQELDIEQVIRTARAAYERH